MILFGFGEWMTLEVNSQFVDYEIQPKWIIFQRSFVEILFIRVSAIGFTAPVNDILLF